MSTDTSKVASSNGTTAAVAAPTTRVGKLADWSDSRLGLAAMGKKNLRKIFPDHWSFMLGEIALWSFVVLLLSGVFLTLWFKPSMSDVVYQGPYVPMRGISMSEAFASTLNISFGVRGGLLLRQMHHWAAMLFISAMMIHMCRVFFTGAHRKPREINWVIGSLLLFLGTIEGFTGYSLPDDLLSGTGVRAADGFIQAIPIVGTYIGMFLFGGEFPGDAIIPRLYTIHVLLIPGILLGLIAAHMLLLIYHKHTQWAGPGRKETNVVGYPMLPVYAAKAGGFFFVTFGVTAIMGGLLSINPVWKFGPYDPTKVTAGSQPDWYMGWPDGALRIMPGWESHFWGSTWSWNIFVPVILMPTLSWILVTILPFLEAWITGDKREHHLLQRPRNAPTRTAFFVSLMTWYAMFWLAGGNDIIAIKLHLSINQITHYLRVLVFLGPALAFFITRRWCIALQRHDNEVLLHGYETGVIMRSPVGGYSEKHEPIDESRAYALTVRDRGRVGEEDQPTRRGGTTLRSKLRTLYYDDDVQKPTLEELEEARAHAEHEAHALAGVEGHPADGHQFDDHGTPVIEDPLRGSDPH